ncbi:MAG: hypothetical protein C4541_01030 [Candidatus Auribacter fodinae]|jgi:hypothetical protein|uniref:Uncharacterized protein n=1 Tax=Candidatus Auribacter fodinae TaxID=2093366 RepID=A0A3A4RA29_9BACT|nr:MAG: hypothetical protein C4541_01030 [Candidatus Auribacter fodinae]
MWSYKIPNIIEAIQPPPELREHGFTFFTTLKYIRRVMQADANSVPQLKGKFDFNNLEGTFATVYLRNHPELWPDIEPKYSPYNPLSSGPYAITMAVMKLLGNDNGYSFEDPSENVTKPFAPEPVKPLNGLTGTHQRAFETSL